MKKKENIRFLNPEKSRREGREDGNKGGGEKRGGRIFIFAGLLAPSFPPKEEFFVGLQQKRLPSLSFFLPFLGLEAAKSDSFHASLGWKEKKKNTKLPKQKSEL